MHCSGTVATDNYHRLKPLPVRPFSRQHPPSLPLLECKPERERGGSHSCDVVAAVIVAPAAFRCVSIHVDDVAVVVVVVVVVVVLGDFVVGFGVVVGDDGT